MTTLQDIERALRATLPKELHQYIPKLISTLERNQKSQSESINIDDNSILKEEIKELLSALAGKQIQTNNAILTFGEGNQFGDITIRDVIGRDSHTHHYHIHLGDVIVKAPTSSQKSLSQHKAKTTTPSNSKQANRSKKTPSTTNFLTNTHIHTGVMAIPFAGIGFGFGWYALVFATNTQYLYKTGHEYSPERAITAIVCAIIGGLIGFLILTRKRRANKVGYLGHLAGFVIAGSLASGLLGNITVGMFWLGGVIIWILFWLFALKGYKEF